MRKMKAIVQPKEQPVEAKITIRFEFIFLLVELMKINNMVDWSWCWITSIIWIPYSLSILLKRWIKNYCKKNGIPYPEKKPV